MTIETKPYLQDLFDHMRNEHGLILLQSEMQEIVSICNTDLNAENEKIREVLREIVDDIEESKIDWRLANTSMYKALITPEIFDKAKQLITEEK